MEDPEISNYMSAEPVSVAPGCSIPELLEALAGSRGHCVIVCEERIPVGIVTHRDLAEVLARVLRGDDARSLTALDVMAFPPFTLSEDEPISDALARVQQRGFSRVPLVNARGELVGVVKLSHLLQAHSDQLDAKRESLQQLVDERTGELVAANERLQQLSLEDPLMGIGNRRAMHDRLAELHGLARRYGTPYSVIMLDLDHFKAYNDVCGHPRGDEILRHVASILAGGLRKSDQLFRYGGEEVLALLPQTGLEGARELAERFRARIERRAIPHPASPHPVVTLSCGIATAFGGSGISSDWSQVVAAADQALYRAKDAGRNRVCS